LASVEPLRILSPTCSPCELQFFGRNYWLPNLARHINYYIAGTSPSTLVSLAKVLISPLPPYLFLIMLVSHSHVVGYPCWLSLNSKPTLAGSI
jgi:hypothetical protein